MSSLLHPPHGDVDIEQTNRWVHLEDLSTQKARRDFVARHSELLRTDVVSSISALVPQLVKSDRNRALAVAETAMMIAERLGDTQSKALSLRAKANAHYALGENQLAVEHHQKALSLFRSIGCDEQIARTLSSSLQPLILQGRYRQALLAAREARRIFTDQGNRWRLARLELNIGNLFDRKDQFEKSIGCYERAYEYLLGHEQGDPEGVAVALHNLAVAYVNVNDFRKAECTYQKARRFASAHDMPVLVGQADYNIAWLHYLRGDYGQAISMLRGARDTCLSSGDQYHLGLAHLDLSEIYLELNLIAEAGTAAEQAEAAFTKLGMQYERAKAITNLAVALNRQGDAGRSLDLFLQAREIFVGETNKVYPFIIDFYRAIILLDEGNITEAHQLCAGALRAFHKFRLTSKAITCRLLLARIYLQQNNIRAAQLQSAHALKSLDDTDLPSLACRAYALRGQIYAAAGHRQQAYSAYQRAKDYLEQLRSRLHGDELKISFMKDRVEIYESLIALLLQSTRKPPMVAEIFGYIQVAKSRTLLDSLSAFEATFPAVDDDTGHAEKIRELRGELNWYFHMTEEAQLKRAPRRKILALRAESQKRETEFLTLVREHTPAMRRPGAETQSTPLHLQHVRESLSRETLILEYFQVHGRLIVLLINHEETRIIPLGDISPITMLLELLQLQISKLRFHPAYVATFSDILLQATRVHLHELYRLLIEPIRAWIADKHLVIAPHGSLHNLPFHALFDGERYLIDEFTMSYAPSAGTYALCSRRVAQTDNRSLVLGLPDPAVPSVLEEVQAVAGCLPHAEMLVGDAATVEQLRKKGSGSRFIHIATHGYFRKDNPMFSGIRLGDGYLSLYDLNQMSLPAELVTLSGCSTGLNVVSAGDELLGLARGLLQAGAESTLLTLWDVQDQSTTELMKSFYGNQAAGCCKTLALQRAILKVKSERPHPYYWAPFVLVGKP